MANSQSPQTKWSPTSFTGAAHGLGVIHIPYAGDVPIMVTTAPDRPIILVARSSFGAPRPEFVDQVIKRFFGTQDSGEKHEWQPISEVQTFEPAERAIIPVDNPKVASFLEEKING